MSRTSSWPARQPRLLLAGEHLQLDAGALLDPVEHLQPVHRLADGRGDQGHELVAPLLLGAVARRLHRLEEGLLALLGQDVVVVHVLGQAQHGALVVHGRGMRAAVGVHHDQVDGVRSDVQDPEAHAVSLPDGPLQGAQRERSET